MSTPSTFVLIFRSLLKGTNRETYVRTADDTFALSAGRLCWPEAVPMKVLSEHIMLRSAVDKAQMLHRQLVLPCRRRSGDLRAKGTVCSGRNFAT